MCSPLQCIVPCSVKSPLQCAVYGRSLCRSTHSRHPILRPTAECRWKSINLGSFSHSAHSAHPSTLCVCAAHLSICVDSVAPRAAARGAVGKAGSGELPAHYQRLLPISPCHHSRQTYHFVIPSARSNAPNG